uniref:Uncharacterized protein n=1 Tax=Arion vulgaris TaxID=1028688 RepID=A0A0B7AMS7_9EUPU
MWKMSHIFELSYKLEKMSTPSSSIICGTFCDFKRTRLTIETFFHITVHKSNFNCH